MRRRLIVGNWKMNGGRAALAELDAIGAAAQVFGQIDVAIGLPFTLIERAALRARSLIIGAQDCHAAPSGPYTGCISAGMLEEAGAKLVIVGHSARRSNQGETDPQVKAKAEAAIAAGLIAIVCVGETGAQHEAGEAQAVVRNQLLKGVPAAGGDRLVVAYEPVWAIGTGLTPSIEDVRVMHHEIRAVLSELMDGKQAKTVHILYGGSMNAGNAAQLLAIANVDGGLIGGASLTAATFIPIIDAAARQA